MYTNDPNGMNNQSNFGVQGYSNVQGYQNPNYQSQPVYQQTPNYQNQPVYQQTPNYQYNQEQQNQQYYQQPQNNMYQQAPQGYTVGYGYPVNGGNNQTSGKAPNIFMQFFYSFVPPKYHELAKVKVGVMIWFVVLLVWIMTTLSLGSMVFSYVINGGVDVILDELPNFTVENGEFWIEEPYEFDYDTTYVYITDEVDEFNYFDVKMVEAAGYTDILLIGRENYCVYQVGELNELDFSDLGSISFSKDTIRNQIVPFVWICIVVGYAIWFVLRVLWYFLCAAVYMLVAMLVAWIAKKNVSAASLFKAAVYSKVFMFLFVSLWDILPISFGFPGILRVLATTVFLVFATLSLPEKN